MFSWKTKRASKLCLVCFYQSYAYQYASQWKISFQIGIYSLSQTKTNANRYRWLSMIQNLITLKTLNSLQVSPVRRLVNWCRVTHICVSKLTIICSDDGLSPDRHWAIILTNDGILLIGPVGANFREIIIKIHTFSFKTKHLKMTSVKWRPFFFRRQCIEVNISSFS